MTITSAGGFFAFALQNAKTTDGGYVAPVAWNRHKATDVSVGIQQVGQNVPLEVGGAPVPVGGYKSAQFFQGGVTLFPRLEDSIGHILKGVMGAVDAPAVVTGAIDLRDHVFHFATDSYIVPWFEFRKFVPRSQATANALLEIGKDCKAGAMTLTLPPNGLLEMNLGVVGRTGTLDYNPTIGGGYAAAENADSLPLSCIGGITSTTINGGVSIPAVGFEISMINQMTQPQQEMIIGSYNPDDFAILSRAMQFRLILKWNNPEMYQQTLTGLSGASGETWDPAPFYSDLSVAAYSADDVNAADPDLDLPYMIKVDAQKVFWQPNGSPRMRGGQMILQEFVGVVNEPDSGEYATITLRNARTTTY